MILVLVTVGTVAGLSIHLIEPITRNEAVVILSTRMSSNVPMVITSAGESQRVSELPVSIGIAWHSLTGIPIIILKL